MNRPNRFILRMVAFLLCLGAVSWPLFGGLVAAFQHNAGLNGLVLGIFVTGIIISLRQVMILVPETGWLRQVKCQSAPSGHTLRLLAPLANMLDKDWDGHAPSAAHLRTTLDSIAARLDEQRELGRYFVGLLIFLGLLGTFWGLSHAVGSMGDVIRSLSLEGGDANAAFEKLKSGMEAPLGGMGMAFSTSLFGLAGSLILGFLDLQAGQAQNAFYTEVEDWLASLPPADPVHTIAAPTPASPGVSPAYVQAVLHRTAERLDDLTAAVQSSHKTSVAQTEMISLLTDQLRANQAMIGQLAEQDRQIPTLLTRLIEETIVSRTLLSDQLQAEIRLLARTLTAPVDDQES